MCIDIAHSCVVGYYAQKFYSQENTVVKSYTCNLYVHSRVTLILFSSLSDTRGCGASTSSDLSLCVCIAVASDAVIQRCKPIKLFRKR